MNWATASDQTTSSPYTDLGNLQERKTELFHLNFNINPLTLCQWSAAWHMSAWFYLILTSHLTTFYTYLLCNMLRTSIFPQMFWRSQKKPFLHFWLRRDEWRAPTEKEDYYFIYIYVQLPAPHHWTTFTRDNTSTIKAHRRDMWLLLLCHMEWNQTYFELEDILQKSKIIGRIVWTTVTTKLTKYKWFLCCIFRDLDLEPWPPWQQWRYVSLCVTVWVCHELHRQQSFDLSGVRL